MTTIAVVFAVLTGANEGGAVATTGFHHRALRPIGALGALTLGVMFVPALIGAGVAHTLASQLVTPEAPDSTIAFGVGLCAAMAVVGGLTLARLPTSLSLAMVGGLTGAGLGFGLPVLWSGVGEVLLLGALAPLLGAAAGAGLARALGRLSRGAHLPAGMYWATLVGYALQVVAYGANGAQKMVAVFVVCGLAGTTGKTLGPPAVLTMGGCFAAGALLSARRVSGSFARDLLPTRPIHHLSAELASTGAVLGSVAVGMPVSMTQVLSAAFVGAGVNEGRQRIRWDAASRLGTAWCLTLPASVAVGLSAAAVVQVVR